MKSYFKTILLLLCFSVSGQESMTLEYNLLKPKKKELLDLIDKAYDDSLLDTKEKLNKKIVTVSIYKVSDTLTVDIGIYQQLFTSQQICEFDRGNYCGAFYYKDKLVLVVDHKDKELFSEFFEKRKKLLSYKFLFGYDYFSHVYYNYINNKFIFYKLIKLD